MQRVKHEKKAALYRGFETIYSESLMSWKMVVVIFLNVIVYGER
jgi:hypothetical protein